MTGSVGSIFKIPDLRRIGATRVHDDTPVIRGMIFQVKHLLKVEEL